MQLTNIKKAFTRTEIQILAVVIGVVALGKIAEVLGHFVWYVSH
jgi:hypothetical protein